MGLNNKMRLAAVAALAVSMAVGCADGKPKKRQPVRKNPNAVGQQKIDPKTGKPVNPAAPAAPAETDADRQKKAEELKKKTEAEKKFDGMVAQMTEGQLMDKSALVDGTYKLSQFTSSLKYMPTNGGWMRAFRTQAVNIDAAGAANFDQNAPSEGMGAAANDPDAAGRVLEVPMTFEVKKEGGIFRGERSSFKDLVLVLTRVTSVMNKGDFKIDVKTELSEARAERATVKASVAESLATNALEDKQTHDLKYSVSEGSKQIDLRLRKISDTKIRVIFDIVEIKDTMLRTVVLDYDVTATPAAASQPPPPAAEGDVSAGLRGNGTPPPPDNTAGAPTPPAVPSTVPEE